jgi:isoamylase
MNEWHAQEGSPTPLGVSWIESEQSFNFAIYARNATSMELLVFAQDSYELPLNTFQFDPMLNRSGRIWHKRIAAEELSKASYYAYRAGGEFNPAAGHRYDAQKLLLDPYAHDVLFPPNYSRTACSRPGNTMGRAPLATLRPALDQDYDWEDDQAPRHQHDLVIYEMHLRGFTRDPSSGVPAAERGTYTGLIKKIPHLLELGVTAVELMPVQQFDPQEANYWGYMTLNFFSPHHAYGQHPGRCEQLNEFRDMVKALHKAGIEVILDVVYNHTSEADEDGPTYSFRGLDNHTYYLLGENKAEYINDAGTGNVLNSADRYVRHLIVESLRFWVREMHVDGFRFDLASIFTRDAKGGVNLIDPPIIAAISSDPDFKDIRLIAEAWDITSYQLGSKFPGITWMQWNGQFRDDLRRFVKSDEGQVTHLMTRLYGSDDLFPDRLPDIYHPYQSVNFITAHDGFTLYDLVSYNQKHNLANGHNNTDGTDSNFSWNHGWEGDKRAPEEVLALRYKQAKNLFALLMLSNGTPMMLMGDEMLNTQDGNNNPYNQDNAITWLQWDRREIFAEHFRFCKLMIALRKQHPTFGRSRYWREDVRWYGVQGPIDFAPNSHSLAFYLDGARENDDDFYVMVNAFWEPLEYHIQEPGDWFRLVDTDLPSPEDILAQGDEIELHSNRYTMAPRSLVVLVQKRCKR